jgi:hypothetical protein
VPLMSTQPQGTALHHAFNACAFALLGNRSTADGVNLSQLSLKEHTLALAQTHKALGNPTLLRADATLAAVLLLCLYEVSGVGVILWSGLLLLTWLSFRTLRATKRAGCWHGAPI